MIDSFRKLTPQRQVRNPVMFVVYVGSILTTLLFVQALVGKGEASAWFIFAVSIWLWFTVLFANFAEAMAEGRGKAQAASLRKARRDVQAKRLSGAASRAPSTPVSGASLRKGDVVLVEAGDIDPRRRRGHRRHRLGERERHHRGERAGDPGERRRSQRRDRRHPGPVGLDRSSG